MRATIRDGARRAGVLIATVSRVMRDSATMRPETRERVLSAADELEFVPNELGRQLAERRHAAHGARRSAPVQSTSRIPASDTSGP